LPEDGKHDVRTIGELPIDQGLRPSPGFRMRVRPPVDELHSSFSTVAVLHIPIADYVLDQRMFFRYIRWSRQQYSEESWTVSGIASEPSGDRRDPSNG
jgi:hypothetical protein